MVEQDDPTHGVEIQIVVKCKTCVVENTPGCLKCERIGKRVRHCYLIGRAALQHTWEFIHEELKADFAEESAEDSK